MLQSGDSALGITLRRELAERIDGETAELIKSPTERRAGRIQAFQDILRLIDGAEDKINNPETARG